MKITLGDKETTLGKATVNKGPVRIGLEEETPRSFADISQLRLSEVSKRNMAIEIYSEILGCTIWLCSNELMAKILKEDYSGAITYTVHEMKELIRVNSTPADLKRIHDAKGVFPGAKIIESNLERGSDEEH